MYILVVPLLFLSWFPQEDLSLKCKEWGQDGGNTGSMEEFCIRVRGALALKDNGCKW